MNMDKRTPKQDISLKAQSLQGSVQMFQQVVQMARSLVGQWTPTMQVQPSSKTRGRGIARLGPWKLLHFRQGKDQLDKRETRHLDWRPPIGSSPRWKGLITLLKIPVVSWMLLTRQKLYREGFQHVL